jgi:PTH1 family peptidyl-tRNA hydrolase
MTNLIIVGLGNPGKTYANTRHNIGATWVKQLCNKYHASFCKKSKLNAEIAQLPANVLCAIPQDYMNHSGIVIKKIIEYYRYSVENLLVVHDELDLSPGDIKIKLSGGHGGHNGLRDIIGQLQNNNFTRLRIGIGHPQIRGQVSDYVLSPATGEEKIAINHAIERGLAIDDLLLSGNWQQAIQVLHQNSLTKDNNGV